MPNVNPSADALWSKNAVVSGIAREHNIGPICAPLSIKAVRKGSALWRVDRREYRVDEDCYLVVNAGQNYGLTIDSATPVETRCFFFEPGFVERVSGSMTAKVDSLLENEMPTQLFLRERLNPLTGSLRKAVREPASASEIDDDLFLLLAESLVVSQKMTKIEEQRIETAREATRSEVYRRLEIARDYLLSNLENNPSLVDAASVAGLSPFHFHRLFRLAFNQTPHGFLTDYRVQRAVRLLMSTDKDLAEICSELGFLSVGSFCRSFRKHTGKRPGEFRKIGQSEPMPSR